MTLEVLLGHKFNDDHHHAVFLTRYLGVSRGMQICLKEGWYRVFEAIIEQQSIIDELRFGKSKSSASTGIGGDPE